MRAIRSNAPPPRLREPFGFRLVIDRADELGGFGEGRVFGIDLDLGQQGRDRAVMAQGVFKRLLDHVTDHAIGFRPQHIQREHCIGFVGRTLQCKQADLRPVAVGDDQPVSGLDDLRQRGSRGGDVLALRLGGQRLATAQQCIAPQCGDNQHR